MATPADLITDETFVQRVVVAFARVAHAALTPANPAPPPDVRKRQLEAVRYLASPAQARALVQSSLALVVASPEVLTALAGAGVPSDADLLAVSQRILAGYTEYLSLGGSLS